eukprot:TRINITY_DN6743_c0_g1_i1.p2 TRINITY_DN6743_c0_g1~~TRINITY_DN6743_c0_g1_i1.p2  ORF type:complete len:162 (+),score=25.85 TRINITY_DN6743_c0_g1_i1:243-728(+)
MKNVVGMEIHPLSATRGHQQVVVILGNEKITRNVVVPIIQIVVLLLFIPRVVLPILPVVDQVTHLLVVHSQAGVVLIPVGIHCVVYLDWTVVPVPVRVSNLEKLVAQTLGIPTFLGCQKFVRRVRSVVSQGQTFLNASQKESPFVVRVEMVSRFIRKFVQI